MVLYRNSEPAKQVLDTTELDPTVDLYPAITFLDDDATKLQTIVCPLTMEFALVLRLGTWIQIMSL